MRPGRMALSEVRTNVVSQPEMSLRQGSGDGRTNRARFLTPLHHIRLRCLIGIGVLHDPVRSPRSSPWSCCWSNGHVHGELLSLLGFSSGAVVVLFAVSSGSEAELGLQLPLIQVFTPTRGSTHLMRTIHTTITPSGMRNSIAASPVLG
jgi:hypothetical protein